MSRNTPLVRGGGPNSVVKGKPKGTMRDAATKLLMTLVTAQLRTNESCKKLQMYALQLDSKADRSCVGADVDMEQ